MPDDFNGGLPHFIPVNMYHAFQTESCVTNGWAQLDESTVRLFFVSLHPQKILPVSLVNNIGWSQQHRQQNGEEGLAVALNDV